MSKIIPKFKESNKTLTPESLNELVYGINHINKLMDMTSVWYGKGSTVTVPVPEEIKSVDTNGVVIFFVTTSRVVDEGGGRAYYLYVFSLVFGEGPSGFTKHKKGTTGKSFYTKNIIDYSSIKVTHNKDDTVHIMAKDNNEKIVDVKMLLNSDCVLREEDENAE